MGWRQGWDAAWAGLHRALVRGAEPAWLNRDVVTAGFPVQPEGTPVGGAQALLLMDAQRRFQLRSATWTCWSGSTPPADAVPAQHLGAGPARGWVPAAPLPDAEDFAAAALERLRGKGLQGRPKLADSSRLRSAASAHVEMSPMLDVVAAELPELPPDTVRRALRDLAEGLLGVAWRLGPASRRPLLAWRREEWLTAAVLERLAAGAQRVMDEVLLRLERGLGDQEVFAQQVAEQVLTLGGPDPVDRRARVQLAAWLLEHPAAPAWQRRVCSSTDDPTLAAEQAMAASGLRDLDASVRRLTAWADVPPRSGLRGNLKALGQALRTVTMTGRLCGHPLERVVTAEALPPHIAALLLRIHRAHVRATWPNLWASESVGTLLGAAIPWRKWALHPLEGPGAADRALGEDLPARTVPLGRWAVAASAWGGNGVVQEQELFRRLQDPPAASARRAWPLAGSTGDVVQEGAWRRLVEEAVSAQSYRRHTMPKRGGGKRVLDVPTPALAARQRVLLAALNRAFPAGAHAAAFQAMRPPTFHARMHAGAVAAVVVDVKDFFPSVRPQQVEAVLTGAVDLTQAFRMGRNPTKAWSPAAVEAVLRLGFLHPADGAPAYLPQGAPSSPALANLAAAIMDLRVQALSDRVFGVGRAAYSRYADDLVLSTHVEIPGFTRRAERLLRWCVRSMGWRVATGKTRFWEAGGAPLQVCGMLLPASVNGPLRLPREVARRVRAARHTLAGGALSGERQRRDVGRALGRERRTPARGLLSYAYSVTADLALLAFVSRRVHRLAAQIAGPVHADAFLAGWAASDPTFTSMLDLGDTVETG